MTTIKRLLAKAETKTADARTDLAKQILSVGLAGLGAGVAGRSIMGLRNLSRPPVAMPFISPGPSPLPIPVPAPQPTEEELAEEAALGKVAADGLYEQAANTLGKFLPEQPWSREVASVVTLPIAGGLGAVGGWKLTDWMLDKRRKAQLDEELANAQAEYETALQSQFQPKMASADDKINVGLLLDELYGVMEKTAAVGVTSGLAGAYLLAASVLGGGAAYGTYNWAKNRSPAAMLAKAQKERARRLWAQTNQPIVAVPQPIPQPALN